MTVVDTCQNHPTVPFSCFSRNCPYLNKYKGRLCMPHYLCGALCIFCTSLYQNLGAIHPIPTTVNRWSDSNNRHHWEPARWCHRLVPCTDNNSQQQVQWWWHRPPHHPSGATGWCSSYRKRSEAIGQLKNAAKSRHFTPCHHPASFHWANPEEDSWTFADK